MTTELGHDPFIRLHRQVLDEVARAGLAIDRGAMQDYRDRLAVVAETLESLACAPNPYVNPETMRSFGILYSLCARRLEEARHTAHRGRLRVVAQIVERLLETQLELRRRAALIRHAA